MPYNGKDARICAELSQVAYQRRSEIARRIAAVIGANATFYLSTSFAGNSRGLFVAEDDSVWIV